MRQAHAPFVALLAIACGGAHASTTTEPPSDTSGSSSTPTTSSETSAPPIESDIVAMGGAFVGSMPVPVTSFGAASLGDAVYVAGGYFGEPHHYSREGQSSSFARFTATHTWEPLAPLDDGLQGLALVAVDGALVRCGGTRIDNDASAPTDMHSIASCARYDVASNAWSALPDLPEARSSFDAAVLDGRIYAVGGWNLEGGPEHAHFHDTVAVLDPGASAWRTVAAPMQRRALAVVATSRHIVVVGGLGDDRAPSSRVDVYDPGENEWTLGPDLPGDGFGVAAVAVGDVVYASGQGGTVYRWTDGESGWSVVRTLAQPRFFHRLVAPSGSLLALGGIGSMTTDGRARLIESVTLAGEPERVGWVNITFPGVTRNRAGLFAHDDSLYLFGGNNSTEQHDFQPTNFVTEGFRLHLPSQRWFPIDALPEGRQSLETVVMGEAAVALGGFGHDEDAPRTYADAFFTRMDGHWQQLRDALPAGRTQFGAAAHDGALYLFAGLTYDDALPEEQRFTHLASVLRCPLDEAALAASSAASPLGTCVELDVALPGTRRAFASATIGDRFYIVGGMRDGFAPVEDCFAFDFQSQTFSPLTCPSHSRISATMLAHDGHLYLVGGSRRTDAGLGPDRSVEVLDPATSTWSTLIEELPFDTHQARWTVVHDRIVAIATQAATSEATLAWVDVQP